MVSPISRVFFSGNFNFRFHSQAKAFDFIGRRRQPHKIFQWALKIPITAERLCGGHLMLAGEGPLALATP